MSNLNEARIVTGLCLPAMLALGLSTGAARAQPTEFHQAPMLAQRVQAGDLPPVAERLPAADDLVVIEPVEEIGQYGGTIRTTYNEPSMGFLKMWMYDPPVRWNRDYTAYS